MNVVPTSSTHLRKSCEVGRSFCDSPFVSNSLIYSSSVCSLCSSVFRDITLFQHINSNHVTRHEFSDVSFIASHKHHATSVLSLVLNGSASAVGVQAEAVLDAVVEW